MWMDSRKLWWLTPFTSVNLPWTRLNPALLNRSRGKEESDGVLSDSVCHQKPSLWALQTGRVISLESLGRELHRESASWGSCCVARSSRCCDSDAVTVTDRTPQRIAAPTPNICVLCSSEPRVLICQWQRSRGWSERTENPSNEPLRCGDHGEWNDFRGLALFCGGTRETQSNWLPF